MDTARHRRSAFFLALILLATWLHSTQANAQTKPGFAPQEAAFAGLAGWASIDLMPGIGMEGAIEGGFGVQGRLGVMIPETGLAVEATLGTGIFGITDELYYAYPSDEVFTLWLGADLRYVLENPSPIQPFLGTGLILRWGGLSDRTTFGPTATAGLMIMTSESFAFEIGATVSYEFVLDSGGVLTDDRFAEQFREPDLYVSPTLSFTWYR